MVSTQSWSKPVEAHKNVLESIHDYRVSAANTGRMKEFRNDALPPLIGVYNNIKARMNLDGKKQEVQKAFTEDYKNRDKSLNGILDLEIKQDGMIKKMRGFSKFINQNAEKRLRSAARVVQDADSILQAQEEFQATAVGTYYLLKVEDFISDLVDTYDIFENFVQKVAANSKRNKTVVDVINRYKALDGARRRLADNYKYLIDEIEGIRYVMFKISRDLTSRILVSMNKLKDTESGVQDSIQIKHHWENRLINLQTSSIDKMCETLVIKNFLYAFLRRLVDMEELPPNVMKMPVKKQVDLIRDNMNDLRKLARYIKRGGDPIVKRLSKK